MIGAVYSARLDSLATGLSFFASRQLPGAPVNPAFQSTHAGGFGTGYEENYRNVFTSIQQLKNYSAWQSSGLIGLAKQAPCDYTLLFGGMKIAGDMKPC